MRAYRDSRLTKIALVVFFLFVIGYAYFEARGMLFGPRITIDTQQITAKDAYITIKGHADRIAFLLMNGREISVTESGAFSEPFVLSPGINRIIFEAKDKYGRLSEKIVEIVLSEEGKLPVKSATSSVSYPESLSATTTTTQEESGVSGEAGAEASSSSDIIN